MKHQPSSLPVRRMTAAERARAMVRCRLFSQETWANAVRQFLDDPETAPVVQEELRRLQSPGALVLLLVMLAGNLFAADLIPSDRTNAWGNWIYNPPPVATLRARTVHATYDSASAPSLSTLNSAIAACPSNQIVLLTASGGAAFTFAGRITVAKNGAALVGETNATGQPSVVINNTGSSAVDMIYLSGGQGSSGDIFSGQTAYTVDTSTASQIQKGSTRIVTTATPTGIAVGDIITIDQLEDDAAGLVDASGNSGHCNWCGRENGNRPFAQSLLVTNVSGTTIDFEPPLYNDFDAAQTIQVIEQPSIVRNITVANLILTNTASSRDTAAVHGAHRSGFINCKLYISDRRASWEFGGMQNFYVDCDFRFGDGADWSSAYTSDSAYGVFLGQNGTATLIKGCYFGELSYPIALEGSRMGDVVAYNFVTNVMNDSLDIGKPSTGNHGAHPCRAYFVGNWFAARLSMDRYWGSSSGWFFLRNYFFIVSPQNGTPVDQYWVVADFWRDNVYHTMVGNLFGKAGVENKYHVASGDSVNSGTSVKAIFRLGNTNANHTTWSQYDTGPTTTIHYAMCWLSRTNTSSSGAGVFYGDGITDTNVPFSLHETSKPVEQGFLPWPNNNFFSGPQSETNVWSGYRARFGTNPPAASEGGGGDLPFTRGKPKLRGLRFKSS